MASQNLISTQQPASARPPAFAGRWSLVAFSQRVLRIYNRVHCAVARQGLAATPFKELDEVRRRASEFSDINEHLELIFVETLLRRPRLIVELGVRDGASTFVFDNAARLCGSALISADLDDCSSLAVASHWHFFQGDDVHFASVFPGFCAERGIQPEIDVLFIDTSHYYEHTVQEISAWYPLLSPHAKMIFHDTNMRPIGRRKDGRFALAWDNQRGVIRAIEEFLHTKIDERHPCTSRVDEWLVRHWPNCNGLTILDRLLD